MSIRLFPRKGAVSAVLLLALAVCSVGQNPPSSKAESDVSPQPVTTFKANTRIVLLDVIATDKQGHPVTDLKGDEITIVEQGKPQRLSSFAMVDDKVGPWKPAMRPLDAGVYYNGTEMEAQGGQITVLLLDALNAVFTDQMAGRKQMLKYIDGQHGKRMAVFGLTSSLILLQRFTDDQAKLHSAVDRRGTQQTPLLPSENGSESPADLTQPGNIDAAGANAFFEQFGTVQANTRTRITLDALKSLGRWLAGYPGRKKIIWVSGSFPVQLDPGETARFSTANDFSAEVRETATVLTDAQISVYTIDTQGTQGLGSSTMFSSSQNGGIGFAGQGSGAQVSRAVSGALAGYATAHATASRFAEQTGGLAFYNRNDLAAAVATSVADAPTYYALSYSPEDKKWDGNYRKLEIKTSRPGIQLRYRRGYYALNPLRAAVEKAIDVDRDVDSALVSPLLASGLSFYASAQPAKASAQNAAAPVGTHSIEVRFLVDTKNLLFESLTDGKQHCNVKFFVGVYSGTKLVTHVEKTLDGNLNPETFAKMAQSGMLFHTDVEVPKEKVRLRLIVRDNRSGKIGALDVPYSNEVAAK